MTDNQDKCSTTALRDRVEAAIVVLGEGSLFSHLITDLYDTLAHTEMDKAYYKGIVEGTWPAADQIIARVRGDENALVAPQMGIPRVTQPLHREGLNNK